MINLEMYKNNTSLFAYDLTPDLCNSYHNHIENSGFINLELQFKTALTENITLIVFATFNKTVKIDAAGQVILDQKYEWTN